MAEQLYGIRKYLRDNGYGDDDITYDMNSRTVQLKGKDFYKTNPQAQTNADYGLQQGSTYATQSELAKALRDYRGTDRSNQVDSTVNSMTQNVNNKPFVYQKPAEWSFNKDSNPLYQNAVNSARANITTGQNNSLANLRSKGQANSSLSETLAQQISARELGKVESDILPQIMQQDYQRYRDGVENDYRGQVFNYQAGQDQIRNQSALAQLLNGLNQNDADNAYREDVLANQQKNERIGLAQWLSQTYGVDAQPKYDTQVAFNQVAGMKPFNAQQFDWQKAISDRDYSRGVLESDRSYDLQRLGQQANIANMGQDNAYKWATLGWNKDPNNPDNLYKNAQIGALNNKGQKVATAEDYAGYVDKAVIRDDEHKITNLNDVKSMILSSGLSDSEISKLYLRYGIPLPKGATSGN
ncbi:hypothetical protein [Paenibacillus chitinolyticus]